MDRQTDFGPGAGPPGPRGAESVGAASRHRAKGEAGQAPGRPCQPDALKCTIFCDIFRVASRHRATGEGRREGGFRAAALRAGGGGEGRATKRRGCEKPSRAGGRFVGPGGGAVFCAR